MKLKSIILIGFVFSMFNVVNGQKPIHDNISQALKGFITPQDSTRTKVWWFHGETETTRFGITADLEALKRAGIGGVVFYNQKFGKDESSLPGLSSGWWEMLKFAAKEAQRVGLTFETHVSNGYVAGGPWIKYENAMKRLVASEHLVEGGRALKLVGSVPKYCGFLSEQCWRGFAIRVKQIKSRIKNPRQLKDPESVIKCIPTIFWNRTN
jgi:hypothetical protein